MEEKIKRYAKPQAPRHPLEPVNPEKFRKSLRRLANLISVDDHLQTPYLSFIQNMENILKHHSVSRDKAVVESISDYDHYNYDSSGDHQLYLSEEVSVPNSNYDREFRAYERKMKTYQKHMETYKKEHIIYEAKLKEYERLLPIWDREDREKQIAYHKKAIAKLTKQ